MPSEIEVNLLAKIPIRYNCKAAFTRQTNVGQLVLAKLKLVCVNGTTTCWQTVGEK